MRELLRLAWENYVRPMLRRPKRLQVAALCYRGAPEAREVLLVTSRGTGRWILPKGWPIRGMNAVEAALQEAWEEAGVRPRRHDDTAIGTYSYHKILTRGLALPVETLVFPIEVEALADSFPEAHERERKWVAPAEAAELVAEPELKELLRTF